MIDWQPGALRERHVPYTLLVVYTKCLVAVAYICRLPLNLENGISIILQERNRYVPSGSVMAIKTTL